MGDHKSNPTATLANMYPQVMPEGYEVQLNFAFRVQESAHIVVTTPERIRTTAAGVVEVGDDEQGWAPLQAGAKAHALGEPLAVDDCDLVMCIVPDVMDVRGKSLRTSGDAQGVAMSRGPIVEFKRVGLKEFRDNHIAKLNAARDMRSGLVLV
jgi:hypothetical protein